jgi:Family of unknown function (DUF5706)
MAGGATSTYLPDGLQSWLGRRSRPGTSRSGVRRVCRPAWRAQTKTQVLPGSATAGSLFLLAGGRQYELITSPRISEFAFVSILSYNTDAYPLRDDAGRKQSCGPARRYPGRHGRPCGRSWRKVESGTSAVVHHRAVLCCGRRGASGDHLPDRGNYPRGRVHTDHKLTTIGYFGDVLLLDSPGQLRELLTHSGTRLLDVWTDQIWQASLIVGRKYRFIRWSIRLLGVASAFTVIVVIATAVRNR